MSFDCVNRDGVDSNEAADKLRRAESSEQYLATLVMRLEELLAFFRQTEHTPGIDLFEARSNSSEAGLIRSSRVALPDPRLVRKMIRRRQLRRRYFDGELFADPAWDMLLDLTVARGEHTRVSVTSLCIASGVPPTTALRWINVLTEAALIERSEDSEDRRRAFIGLTERGADAMARYFRDLNALTGLQVQRWK